MQIIEILLYKSNLIVIDYTLRLCFYDNGKVIYILKKNCIEGSFFGEEIFFPATIYVYEYDEYSQNSIKSIRNLFRIDLHRHWLIIVVFIFVRQPWNGPKKHFALCDSLR